MFGNFSYDKICNVPLNETIYMTLNIKDNEYELCVDGNCKSIDRPCSMVYKRYKLYPYFGGDECAPHKIKIRIKD